MSANDWCLIELLVIDSNICNHLSLLTCYIELLEIELFESFNYRNLRNVSTNHIFKIYVKIGFGIR